MPIRVRAFYERELICLLLFTSNYVVPVWRGFLFLWVLGMGYVILLWHSLSLPYNYFAHNLGCGYKLEPGLFNVYPCKLQLYNIYSFKSGSSRVKIIRASEHDVIFNLISGVSATVKRLGRSTKLAELGL